MPKDPKILQSSRDQKELVDTAVELAASEHSTDQATLLQSLNSKEFLLRLNTEKEYDTSRPKHLRVAKVMRVLRDSPHNASNLTLIGLARGGAYVEDNWLRQELLVRALVKIRPATPEAIQFWDKQSTPTAVNRHITIDMLCENGTDPAMVLLEQKLLDPSQEIEYKIAWIRDCMLRHRNDPPLLRASERMIAKTLPLELRLVLLESLCTYDPEWYPGCSRPKPPPRMLASAEAKEILRRICIFAKENLELPPHLRVAVETTLAEIGNREQEKSAPPGPR